MPLRPVHYVAAAALALVGVLVLAGLLVLPAIAKSRVAAAIERATGRQARVDSVAILPAWPPTVMLTGLTVANIPGGSRPDMLTVPRLTVAVDPLSLLTHETVLTRVVAEQPDLLLETDAAGQPNWRFTRPAAAATGATNAAPVEPRQLRVSAFKIERGVVTRRDGKSGDRLKGEFGASGSFARTTYAAEVDGDADGVAVHATITAGQPTLVALSGTRHALPFRAELRTNPIDGFASGPVPVEGTLTSAGGSATLRGTVAVWPVAASFDAAIAAQTPDLAVTASSLGRGATPAGPAAFSGRITRVPGADLRLSGFAASWPGGDLSGDLSIGLAGRPRATGTVRSRHIDLDKTLAVAAGLLRHAQVVAPASDGAGSAGHQPAPGTASTPSAPPSRLIPETTLPFDRLLVADASIDATFDTLVTGGATYRDVTGHLALAGGRLVLDPFGGGIAGVRITATAHVDATQPAPPIALVLHAPAIALAPLLTAFHAPDAVRGVAWLDLDLRSAGRTPRALAAGLDGHVAVTMIGGEVENDLLSRILAAARLPAPRLGGTTQIRCLAARAEMQEGMATVAPFVLDTSRVLVQAGGSVNLRDETLALRLRPLLRAGPGLVVPVRLDGGWRDPKAQLDAVGVSADLFGADTAERGADPCAPALAAARGPGNPAADLPLPPPPPSTGKRLKPADLLRSLLR